MNLFLPVSQIAVSILLVTSILLQKESAGLGTAFGAGGGMHHSRRGSEKYIFIATIILSSCFIVLSLIGIFI